MEIFISFLVSVMAGVVSYYICKWLGGNDSDNQPADALPYKKEKKPQQTAICWGFVCAYTLSFHFLASFTIAYASYHFKILLTNKIRPCVGLSNMCYIDAR